MIIPIHKNGEYCLVADQRFSSSFLCQSLAVLHEAIGIVVHSLENEISENEIKIDWTIKKNGACKHHPSSTWIETSVVQDSDEKVHVEEEYDLAAKIGIVKKDEDNVDSDG